MKKIILLISILLISITGVLAHFTNPINPDYRDGQTVNITIYPDETLNYSILINNNRTFFDEWTHTSNGITTLPYHFPLNLTLNSSSEFLDCLFDNNLSFKTYNFTFNDTLTIYDNITVHLNKFAPIQDYNCNVFSQYPHDDWETNSSSSTSTGSGSTTTSIKKNTTETFSNVVNPVIPAKKEEVPVEPVKEEVKEEPQTEVIATVEQPKVSFLSKYKWWIISIIVIILGTIGFIYVIKNYDINLGNKNNE